MGKEGKPKNINGEMPFNPIGRFVKTVSFRVYTRITSVFHRLGVNDEQGCPLGLFLTCCRTCPCKTLISCSNTPAALQ